MPDPLDPRHKDIYDEAVEEGVGNWNMLALRRSFEADPAFAITVSQAPEALVAYARSGMWLLPGLWAILFSLGLFSCRRVVPIGIVIPAGYYLLAGLLCITVTQGASAFSPWSMVWTFGVGQFLTAGVLFCVRERHHG